MEHILFIDVELDLSNTICLYKANYAHYNCISCGASTFHRLLNIHATYMRETCICRLIAVCSVCYRLLLYGHGYFYTTVSSEKTTPPNGYTRTVSISMPIQELNFVY